MAWSTWQNRKAFFVFFFYFFIHDGIYGQMAIPRQKTGISMVKGSLSGPEISHFSGYRQDWQPGLNSGTSGFLAGSRTIRILFTDIQIER
jgi:hypothetical protein